MCRRRGPPSTGWRAFLRIHTAHIAAIDLFVIPAIGFKFLYGLVILRLERRRLVWINVTAHPTAEWIARQITEAFPWDEAPRYLIRDRDTSYGVSVTRRLQVMGIRDRPISPRSPWQNGHVEGLIGSIRRECLHHVWRRGRGMFAICSPIIAPYPSPMAVTAAAHLALGEGRPVSDAGLHETGGRGHRAAAVSLKACRSHQSGRSYRHGLRRGPSVLAVCQSARMASPIGQARGAMALAADPKQAPSENSSAIELALTTGLPRCRGSWSAAGRTAEHRGQRRIAIADRRLKPMRESDTGLAQRDVEQAPASPRPRETHLVLVERPQANSMT